MLNYLSAIAPILIALFIYFIRLESRLAKISTDVTWIKKELNGCRQSSDENIP